jgi:hypothetical protein
MHRRSRDTNLHRVHLIPLSASRHGRRLRGTLWKPVGLLALLALTMLGGREGFDPLGLRDWLGAGGEGPIRAAIAVPATRTDCRLARVIDGDTVDLDCPGQGVVRARLTGFDTPEAFSPGCDSELARGKAATRALDRHIRDAGEMRVAFQGTDRYGRLLARMTLDGNDVAGPMIAEGLARPYGGGARRSWCR